jgi:hypothetical protein
MKFDEGSQTKPALPSSTTPPEPKPAYSRPRVECLGDVRDLTFGGSPGIGDSTNPGTQKVTGT